MRVLHKLRLFLLRLFGKNERYYINGAQSLPPPLDADEEDRLVASRAFRVGLAALESREIDF